MSEDKAFDFSVEIDPNYVQQKRDDPATQNQPARIMTTKAWFMSLLLPVLSIFSSAFFVVLSLLSGCLFVFTAVLGLICGGIVPTVMIVRGKLDTSKFFLGKMIVIAVSVAIWFLFTKTKLEYWIFDIFGGLTYQITILLVELIFAAVQKTTSKRRSVLPCRAWLGAFSGFHLIYGCCSDFEKKSPLWHEPKRGSFMRF